jgi:nucleotide-binding universal stress UspA family protein
MNRILIATDLTYNSLGAVRAGLELAGRLGGQVTVLHVVPHSTIETNQANAAWHLVTEQIRAAGVVDTPEAPAAAAMVRVGRASDEIVTAALELEASLLVTGTHGRGGLEHLLAGSVAETVVRTAPCPVLVVR